MKQGKVRLSVHIRISFDIKNVYDLNIFVFFTKGKTQ